MPRAVSPDKECFLFVGNGQYGNRGCEAITKSSIRLIREFFPGCSIVNGNEGGDFDQVDETEPDVEHRKCECFPAWPSKMWISDRIYSRTGRIVNLRSSPTRLVLNLAPRMKAVISMGGDLYGLSHGRQGLLQYMFLGEAALASRTPFVIWGATLGNLDSDSRLKRVMLDHYRRCSLILVRDTWSRDYLSDSGIEENVRLVADPAFLIDPIKPGIELHLSNPLSESIGFNMSSTCLRLAGITGYSERIAYAANCVESIMARTARPVILIPHVVAFPDTMADNDTLFLHLVSEVLRSKGLHVDQLPSSLRFWEIKWVLGQLRAHVGWRMHSTVSSMGACTPTLSLTFAEKGPALHNHLLGHTKFALDISKVCPGTLSDKLEELMEEEDAVRAILAERMPAVREMAHSAGEHLRDLLVAR